MLPNFSVLNWKMEMQYQWQWPAVGMKKVGVGEKLRWWWCTEFPTSGDILTAPNGYPKKWWVFRSFSVLAQTEQMSPNLPQSVGTQLLLHHPTPIRTRNPLSAFHSHTSSDCWDGAGPPPAEPSLAPGDELQSWSHIWHCHHEFQQTAQEMLTCPAVSMVLTVPVRWLQRNTLLYWENVAVITSERKPSCEGSPLLGKVLY
jgi:hypothetical protein